MGMPLLAGREFGERDRMGAPFTAIVNEAWVKVNLGGGNPVGQRLTSLRPRLKPREMEIIGLVKNASHRWSSLRSACNITHTFTF